MPGGPHPRACERSVRPRDFQNGGLGFMIYRVQDLGLRI